MPGVRVVQTQDSTRRPCIERQICDPRCAFSETQVLGPKPPQQIRCATLSWSMPSPMDVLHVGGSPEVESAGHGDGARVVPHFDRPA